MTHLVTCITNQLRGIPSCLWPDGDPRAATRGHVCERCYSRIDYAIGVADRMRIRLAGVDRAITADSGSGFAGPRLPLTALALAFDEIDRAQAGRTDPAAWVSTPEGATDAVWFAKYVHDADQAHPTLEQERPLKRLRCPNCRKQTATWQPPAWPEDDVHITCLSCKWKATNAAAIDIATSIENLGPANDADFVIPFLRARADADRAARKQRRLGAA